LVSKPITLYEVSQLSDDNKNFLKINAILNNITGNCTSGIYNLHAFENTTIEGFNNPDNYTKMVPANITLPNFNHTLTTAKFEFTVTAMTDTFQTYSIATNTSNAMNGTDENNAFKLAQYFLIAEPSHIDYIYLYLNYTSWIPIIWAGIVTVNIFRSDLLTRVNQFEMSIFLPNSNGFGNWTAEWFSVRFNNILPIGNYYLVMYTTSTSVRAPNNNSWQIQNYSTPAEDKGATMKKLGNSSWVPIENDGHADFLLMMNKSTYVSPYEVNLSIYVDNNQVNLNHYYDENPSFLKFPWVSSGIYYIPVVPTEDIKVTITVNQPLGWGAVITTTRFVKFLPAIGNFTATLNSRKWLVNYTSINSSTAFLPVFVFPKDWSIIKFYNRFDQEVVEYGIMYSKVYNKTYNGIYYPETGDGESTYNYSAEFTSLNYVSNIFPQIYNGTGFKTQFSFYKGDTIRLQAKVQGSENNPAINGNCTFYLYNTTNELVHTENVTVVNGIANSDNITNLAEGEYLLIVTWTNGSQVGFNSFTFTISEAQKIFPFIPPSQPEPIWLYIITTALIVLTAMVGGLIARRKLQERHWEKSLLHLFIMNKDGRAMYDYTFGIEQRDPTLISGMLTALTSFIKETVGSKKQLKTIDQEDKKVILGHGIYSTVAVFAEKDLPIIHHKTSEFLQTFENSFLAKIKDWDGSTSIFKGVGSMVEKYFPMSTGARIIQGVGNELLILKEGIVSSSDPQEVISLLQKVTGLAERYKEIIREHFNKEYGEILKIANQKVINLV
ncbi:MAG: hypothetical protein ACFFD2_30835, partial [Promethearchaeota archaeon]